MPDKFQKNQQWFTFKLTELYEHQNTYRISAHTLEEAVEKAKSGEVDVTESDYYDGHVATLTVPVSDKSDEQKDILYYHLNIISQADMELVLKMATIVAFENRRQFITAFLNITDEKLTELRELLLSAQKSS